MSSMMSNLDDSDVRAVGTVHDVHNGPGGNDILDAQAGLHDCDMGDSHDVRDVHDVMFRYSTVRGTARYSTVMS